MLHDRDGRTACEYVREIAELLLYLVVGLWTQQDSVGT